MTISFPNNTLFNSFPIATTKFRLMPRQSISRQGSGQPVGVDFGLPVWMATFTTPPLTHGQCVQLEASINALDGVLNPIFGGDTRAEYPLNYPTGSFTDAGMIAAWGGSGKSVSLSGMPAGFAIALGDYFHLGLGGIRYLFQAMEAVTADGSGNVADFEIRPHYPPGASGTPAVTFKRPRMSMVVDPQSVVFTDGEQLTGTVAFDAMQAF